MSVGDTCPSCGHPNTTDAVFCSKCGAKMKAPARASSAPPAAPPAEPDRPTDPDMAAPPAPEAEVLEPPPPEPEAPEPEEKEPAPQAPPVKRAPRVAGQAKTMLGVGALDKELVEKAKAEAERRRAKKAEVGGGSGSGDAQAQAHAQGQGGPAKRSEVVSGQGRTMLGMPAPDKAKVAEAVERAKQRRAQKDAPAAEGPDAKRPEAALGPTTNRTMLGQPAPRKDQIEAAIANQDAPTKPPEGLTDSGSSGRMRAPVVYPHDTGEQEALTLPTNRPGRGLAIGALVVGVLVLLIGGGALAWALLSGSSALNASVVQGDNGEMLEIEVPGAEAGTRVRFGGEERELEAGRARFELSADDLTLGDNELSVDVVDPSGDVSSETVELHLEMRIRADLGPLSRTPPAIDVVVEAPAGSEVTLDGEALALDGDGRGTRRYPVDDAEASTEGVVDHVVRYRVHPPEGEDATGELRTRIPTTTLQLDRPGAQVVTDQETIEFAGAVAPGATVTVGGAPAEVTDGRFVFSYAIDEVGERTVDVVARVPGRAPRVTQVQLRRVEDLEAEAEAFEFNEELTYARIAQNPATYRGQPVRFDGLVYNVSVRNGQSVVQMLVSPCPDGDRCPLWVTMASATETENRTRVRVLGTVGGEQQFRSQSGQVRTVPRVDATYILPLSP